ncbi:SLH domain-containing protein [Citrus sinensis]|uniref:SLH domain-containing protein n=1 Tax=Citrus sinensis TaxID=2711 RepID=A0ACB8LFE2_CITSI|nr:SLH domain-containing protein [Citrus sinensis]
MQIIEEDVNADELCTRREYARWLVRINSLLERNPKLRIVPSKSLSGTVVAAFNDVDVEDPDIESIQALAEAGVIPSQLLGKHYGSNGSKGQGGIYFFPERFISRYDLINWKAQVDYEVKPDIVEQISRTKMSYMDVREINSEASLGLFMDMLAGEKSIARRVFGQSKRFQPNKPSTKAQAAVALTSGRMAKAISNELSRLEAERSSRQAEMAEIRSQLFDSGDIQRWWDKKFSEERARGFEVEKLYIAARCDLEEELIVQEKNYAEDLKEKAAMDCQRQLLLNLKDEVDEMSGRLESERATYVVEKCALQDTLSDLQTKLEGLLDTKSRSEAEKEALRILRSWVEDEARKSQARAKVLEEVTRRWRWGNHA